MRPYVVSGVDKHTHEAVTLNIDAPSEAAARDAAAKAGCIVLSIDAAPDAEDTSENDERGNRAVGAAHGLQLIVAVLLLLALGTAALWSGRTNLAGGRAGGSALILGHNARIIGAVYLVWAVTLARVIYAYFRYETVDDALTIIMLALSGAGLFACAWAMFAP